MTISRTLTASLVAAGAFAAASPGQAAVILHYAGGGVVNDTDGVTGLADVDMPPFTVSFDIYYDTLGGTDTTGGSAGGGTTGSWGLQMEINDLSELAYFDPASFSASGSVVPIFTFFEPIGPEPTSFELYYSHGGDLADGTLIASFSLTGTNPGLRPHDDLADFGLSGIGTGSFGAVTVVDPISGSAVSSVSYDVQTVPLPAAGWLLIAGLAGLGALRRRAA